MLYTKQTKDSEKGNIMQQTVELNNRTFKCATQRRCHEK